MEFLAARFDTVEIDLSFEETVRPERVKLWNWMARGNPKFRFTARLHRDFTYERQLGKDRVEDARRSLRPLLEQGRLGCLVMQFPWAFRFNSENRDYFIQARREFHGFPLVAEFRHASWMSEEALGVLIDHHVGFANIDQPASLRAMPATAILTSRTAYVRLYGRKSHGRFQKFEERRPGLNYLYSIAELEEWKGRVEHISRFAETVYVSFANSYKGQSVINAMQMRQMLEAGKAEAPRAADAALLAA